MPKTCAGRSRAALLRGLGEEAADIHTLIHRFCALGKSRQNGQQTSTGTLIGWAQKWLAACHREAGFGVTDEIRTSSGPKVTEGAIVRRPEDWPLGRPGS